ncbi:glycosyltransferase [Xanthomonas sp. SI]|uniref:glycosyltransferase n=1 Tax=Xanthomonas sp. SI TaxID=2724123 RepID=UPI001639DCDD|nr:glycosyltransferase [Xanthomonas sp. SI]QNH11642.1 D-inositol-3-phosphate glycosyltransferase [Xanthomonas sp. SI]
MTKPCTVVIITSSFPTSGDGSEAAGAFVADFAIELGKLVNVRVVAPGPKKTKELWCESIEIFRYPTPERPLSTLNPLNPADAWRIANVMRAGYLATEAALDEGCVQHILALWALPCGEWARSCAQKYGVNYSVWTLGSDIWSLGRIPIVRSFLRKVLRNAKHCWSDGLKLAHDTEAIAGREVHLLPSTRRTSRSRNQPLSECPPYSLLFLGRWHPNKGIDLLFEAIDLLTENQWKRIKKIRICGGGPLQREVESNIRRLSEAGRPVLLSGFLDRESAEEAIIDADWLLIPSRIESIPVVFSDAMKLKCPVIATPVGDLPALLQGKTGGVVAKDLSAKSFHKAMEAALLSSPYDLSSGIRELAAQFDISDIAAKVYSSLVTND